MWKIDGRPRGAAAAALIRMQHGLRLQQNSLRLQTLGPSLPAASPGAVCLPLPRPQFLHWEPLEILGGHSGLPLSSRYPHVLYSLRKKKRGAVGGRLGVLAGGGQACEEQKYAWSSAQHPDRELPSSSLHPSGRNSRSNKSREKIGQEGEQEICRPLFLSPQSTYQPSLYIGSPNKLLARISPVLQ